MSTIKEGLLYSESHEWVKVEGEFATIGISDFAQKEMGAITYVDMPDVDDEIEKDDEFGALESVKAASELVAPISGLIVETNEELEDSPELINQDAYASWIIKVKINDLSELDDLMDAKAYEQFLAK